MSFAFSKDTAGMRFLAAAVGASLKDYVRFRPSPEMFQDAEVEVFEFVDAFVRKHSKVPQPATVQQNLKVQLTAPPEPLSFYYDQLHSRFVQTSLRKMNADIAELLKGGPKQEEHAKLARQRVEAAVASLRKVEAGALHVVDFRESGLLLKGDMLAKLTGETSDLRLGWDSVDVKYGGAVDGDLVSMVARPGMGKTMLAIYSARRAWAEDKRTPLVVSMEMKVLPILQRMAATHAGVPFEQIKGGLLTTKSKPKFEAAMTQAKGQATPLWVVDGNLAATVEDVASLATSLGVDCIYIDGAYLLRHPNIRNRYERVAENCDLIKNVLCGDLGLPVFATWQFSRDAAKKLKTKKGGAVDLEDIGYSDAVGQHSSLVMGLFESETVETILHRKVTVLKGRYGQTGEFLVNWSWSTMDFTEHTPKSIKELQNE
jgi:replicative DNA helicase